MEEKSMPVAEGWDEESINRPADTVSQQHDDIFSKWESIARICHKENNEN